MNFKTNPMIYVWWSIFGVCVCACVCMCVCVCVCVCVCARALFLPVCFWVFCMLLNFFCQLSLLLFWLTKSIAKTFYMHVFLMLLTDWLSSVFYLRSCAWWLHVLIQDRVLFRTRKKNQITCLHYDAVMSIKVSDHRAVYAFFEVMLRPGRDKLVVFAFTLTLLFPLPLIPCSYSNPIPGIGCCTWFSVDFATDIFTGWLMI